MTGRMQRGYPPKEAEKALPMAVASITCHSIWF